MHSVAMNQARLFSFNISSSGSSLEGVSANEPNWNELSTSLHCSHEMIDVVWSDGVCATFEEDFSVYTEVLIESKPCCTHSAFMDREALVSPNEFW